MKAELHDVDEGEQRGAQRPGGITLDSSSTAMCVLRRVTIAPPMNTTHIRP